MQANADFGRFAVMGGWRLLGPVRFEVFTAVTMKNGVFWDAA
jgi:hypothetical protein